MPSDFYHWLVLASLKSLLILPVVVIATRASRKTSSTVLALMLTCALLFIPFTPFLDIIPVGWKITLPFLESTAAFSDNIPELIEYDKQSPIPIQASEIGFVTKQWWKTERVVLLIWGGGVLLFTIVRLWKSLNSLLRFSSSVPAPVNNPIKQDHTTRGKLNRTYLS